MEAPDQTDIEKALARDLSHGDIANIARAMHKNRTVVSRQFNPEGELDNPVYAFCLLLYGCKKQKPGTAYLAWSIVSSYWASLNGCAVGELTKEEAVRQVKEIVLSQMKGKTPDEQNDLASEFLESLSSALRETKANRTFVTHAYRPAGAGAAAPLETD